MRFTKYIICLAIVLSSQAFCSQALGMGCTEALSTKDMNYNYSEELANAIVNNDIEALGEFSDNDPYNISYMIVYDLDLFPDLIKQNLKSFRIGFLTASTFKPSLNKAQRKEFYDFISTLKPLNTRKDHPNYLRNLDGTISSYTYSQDSSFVITVLELAVALHGPNSKIVTFLIGLDYNNGYHNVYDSIPPQSLNENEASSLLLTALEKENFRLSHVLEAITPNWHSLKRSYFFRKHIDYGAWEFLDQDLKDNIEVSLDDLAYAFASKNPEVIEIFWKNRDKNDSLVKLRTQLEAFRQEWNNYK